MAGRQNILILQADINYGAGMHQRIMIYQIRYASENQNMKKYTIA